MSARLKYFVVWFLDELDNLLDHAPTWERVDGKLKHFRGGWGCRMGLAGRGFALAERWDVHLPVATRCQWCGESFTEETR
jgi:hypothetical protein